MSIGKKLLIGVSVIPGIVFIGIVFIWVYLAFHFGDDGTVNDTDLTPSTQILSAEDNMYFDFKEIENDIASLTPDEIRSISQMSYGLEWDERVANRVVENNSAALAVFERASWKKGYQSPVLQTDPSYWNANTILESPSVARTLAQLSSLRSQILLKKGDEKKAFDRTLDIVYLGQAIESSPRVTLISALVGVAVKGIGLRTIQGMLPESHLTSSELKKYMSVLDKFSQNEFGFQEAFRMEYTMLKNTKDQLIDPLLGGDADELARAMTEKGDIYITKYPLLLARRFYYKPSQTHQLFTEQFQRFVQDTTIACNKVEERPRRVELGLRHMLFTENSIGKTLTDVSEMSLRGILEKRCLDKFTVLQTQIMLAAQAYKRDRGMYPPSITSLAPEYLERPEVQFDGQDILYDSKTGKVSLASQ